MDDRILMGALALFGSIGVCSSQICTDVHLR